ncbi:MAG: 4Fe-4S binding protein [candidate division Zixibacteria bacterium]|nr:4Fe-4S binding protein [candidate division Zixibacteria bacterium]
MLTLMEVLCTECGACVPVCHVNALRLTISGLKIDQNLCDDCKVCALICPVSALQIEEKELETV